MRLPRECYPMADELTHRLPSLSRAQGRTLALWVLGTILAGRATQSAVEGALRPLVGFAARHALRQRLREWTRSGATKAAPCRAEVEVTACFAPLLRWVVSWWQGTELPLAVDATALGDRVVILTVAVRSRGRSLPVAWQVLPANQPGAWMAPILALLERLQPAVPETWTVVVLSDRGLGSGRLWDGIRQQGWHPLLRVRQETTFRPQGHQRRPATTLIPGPGHAWVGAGTAFKHQGVRRDGTLVIVWAANQAEPWICLTDLDPEQVGVGWYGLRAGIEVGFRDLKALGWQWTKTRRTAPDRISRHVLVLAVATRWTVATGSRVEDADHGGVDPNRIRRPRPPATARAARSRSVFATGVVWLRRQLLRAGRPWRSLWLAPDPWPAPSPGLHLTVIPGPPPTLPP